MKDDPALDIEAVPSAEVSPDPFETEGIERALEATLFAAEEPMSAEALAAHLGDIKVSRVREALHTLARHYSERGVQLVERARRWHFETASDLAHLLRREREQKRRLSRAATEVLAIIAYHEPVSRAEIESIRGVQTAKGTLDVLLEAGWIRLAGRREVPGRPVIYATSPEFLDHFGLTSRRDLPGIDELKAAGLLDPVDEALDEALGGAKDANSREDEDEDDIDDDEDEDDIDDDEEGDGGTDGTDTADASDGAQNG